MSNNGQQIHHTITNRIKGTQQDSWEFVCPICGYQARYTTHTDHNDHQFELLNVGDPQVRHASNHTQATSLEPSNDDEVWLTPDVRQQMEELLRDIDMGDWA